MRLTKHRYFDISRLFSVASELYINNREFSSPLFVNNMIDLVNFYLLNFYFQEYSKKLYATSKKSNITIVTGNKTKENEQTFISTH